MAKSKVSKVRGSGKVPEVRHESYPPKGKGACAGCGEVAVLYRPPYAKRLVCAGCFGAASDDADAAGAAPGGVAAGAAMASAASKNDLVDGKPPLHLIAPDFLVAVARVLAYGARKYAAWNWARGKELSRDYGAALRHMTAWWGGEDLDPESGLPHLAHAATDIMIVYVTYLRGSGKDDRPQLPAYLPREQLEELASPAAAPGEASTVTGEASAAQTVSKARAEAPAEAPSRRKRRR